MNFATAPVIDPTAGGRSISVSERSGGASDSSTTSSVAMAGAERLSLDGDDLVLPADVPASLAAKRCVGVPERSPCDAEPRATASAIEQTARDLIASDDDASKRASVHWFRVTVAARAASVTIRAASERRVAVNGWASRDGVRTSTSADCDVFHTTADQRVPNGLAATTASQSSLPSRVASVTSGERAIAAQSIAHLSGGRSRPDGDGLQQVGP